MGACGVMEVLAPRASFGNDCPGECRRSPSHRAPKGCVVLPLGCVRLTLVLALSTNNFVRQRLKALLLILGKARKGGGRTSVQDLGIIARTAWTAWINSAFESNAVFWK
jgi:hypothetical protein